MDYYLKALGKFATFTGRARRKEYWYFQLFNILVVPVFLAFVEVIIRLIKNGGTFDHSNAILLRSFYFLITIIPSIAVGVRRMHDTGRSGWWLFLPLINLGIVT